MMKKPIYAVLSLLTKIDTTVNGVTTTHKLNDVAGIIACYNTYEEAVKYSFDGKFEIVPLIINDDTIDD